jgi:hypothetical protein
MPKYPYRDLGTSLGRDFRNDLNANFDDIEADLRDIQSDLDAKESRITQIENDSIERDNDLDARIDNLVLSAGDSSPEVADARYDSRTNTTYTTLKDRLDSHSNEIGILNKKGEGFVNVKEYGAKGDYNKATGIGSDDTTALNQVLSDKRGNEIYFPKGTYLISSSLIVYNDTTIRLHPQAEIYLKANSANAAYANSYNGTHLLKNHPTEGIQNIKVIGGIWNGNGANQPHDSMRGLRFEGVTNLSIENVKISEVNGWGIVILKCQKFLCRNIEFDQMEGQAENGDGIHVSSSSDGLIENVYGFTNDDMVALFAGDPLFSYKSDVTNVIVRNIQTKKKGSYDAYKAVALYATNGYKVDNVVIDGITGNTYAPIVIISNPYASSGAGYFGKIAISNVIGNTVSERQPFNIDKYGDSGGDTSKKVFIDSLIISNYQRHKDSAHLNSQPIILAQYADIKNLMITNFNDEYDGAGGQLFKSNYANIDNLTLNGYNRKQVTSGLDSDSVFYMTNTTISSFSISNITDIVLSNGSPVVEVDINCIIKNFKANNIRRNFTTGNTTPFATFLFVHATSEVTDIEVDNINIVSEDNNIPPLIYQYGKIDRAFLSNIKNYSKTLPNPVPLYTKNRTADSQVTLIKFSNVYTGTYYAGYANFSVVAGNVRAVGVDVIADTSKITDPKKGDVVTTKDGNLVIYNGTTWTTIG